MKKCTELFWQIEVASWSCRQEKKSYNDDNDIAFPTKVVWCLVVPVVVKVEDS